MMTFPPTDTGGFRAVLQLIISEQEHILEETTNDISNSVCYLFSLFHLTTP